MDVIFTIVSRNYAAQAMSLMQSVAAQEPTAHRVVVAADGPIPALEPLVEVIDGATLNAPYAAMSVYYEALEFNTALKPYAFRELLARPGVNSVTYLDPDIFVFRPMDRIRQGLESAQLVLTPHLTKPLVGDANPDDRAILRSGVYNLGFAAVARHPKSFALLDWWARKCEFDCRVDLENGLFTDQRWMDLSPGFVDSFDIAREPGLNLAYWNLEGRTLERAADGWRVDGEPLTFFHFSGFDPHKPKVLSKHQDRLKVAPGSPLAELLADFAQVMLKNGHATTAVIPYGHNAFPDGRRVTRPMRRRALRAARAGEMFQSGLSAATSTWFDSPDPERAAPGLPDVTRLEDQVWRDSAAHHHFERDTTEGRLGFRQWMADNYQALEVDAEAVRAAQALTRAAGGEPREAAPTLWTDSPWTGPASEVFDWLRQSFDSPAPRACQALLVARRDLRERFGADPWGLLAWCIGPEAAAGRFALDLLPQDRLAELGRDSRPLLQAARFAERESSANELRRRLAVSFGISARAGWPDSLTGPLRAPHLAPVATLPAPFVQLFLEIWEARPDLQRLYPLTSSAGRFRYLRWLLAGGLAEYGVEKAALPAAVRGHRTFRLAELSIRNRAAAAPRAIARPARTLVVVETLEDGADIRGSEAAVFEASTCDFHGPAPTRVEELVFMTAPALVAADAVALHAQGVSWSRAVGRWDAATVAGLSAGHLGLGFVDEIQTDAAAVRTDLPRPVVALQS